MKMDIHDPKKAAMPLAAENENSAKRPARTDEPLEVDAWLRRLGYEVDKGKSRANAATSVAQLG